MLHETRSITDTIYYSNMLFDDYVQITSLFRLSPLNRIDKWKNKNVPDNSSNNLGTVMEIIQKACDGNSI